VVCSYNGSRTITDTLDHLSALTYPDFEIIVVSDGSTDGTAAMARCYPDVRVIETRNGGLSAARNLGMREATGEIVAYIDDDAYPDPDWMHFLAHAFCSTTHAAIGGPNLPPPDDGPIAECVARAPGGPIHVLTGDDVAEHIPGCNFAVRKSALDTIGGFDPVYQVAGDDVDACWRLERAGYTIGFHPAAVVWHHRRNSLRAYWRQQCGYGKAEALLERKWPERYNAAGHLKWTGRLYGAGLLRTFGLQSRIYHGQWNSAPFQSLYQPALPLWQALAQMPEWYLLTAVFAALCLLGFSWRPLFWLTPLLAAGVLLPLGQIVNAVSRTRLSRPSLRWLTALLFGIQPVARLWGRIAHGLTPWRRTSAARRFHHGFTFATWSENWRPAEAWLEDVRAKTRASIGGAYDRWDLELAGGIAGGARLRLAVEEHGAGKQLLRWRVWQRISWSVVALVVTLAILATAAFRDHAPVAAITLSLAAMFIAARTWFESSTSLGAFREALRR
jgi:GT2 family glycosyltransferase